MNLIEFIGFIITMILVIYLSSKRAIDERKRQLNSSYDEDEADDNLREMFQQLNLSQEDAQALERELKGEPAQPPPPPKVTIKKPIPPKKKRVTRTLNDQYALHTSFEDYKQRSKLAKREFDTGFGDRYEKPRAPIVVQSLRAGTVVDPYAFKSYGKTRANTIINSLKSKQHMILLHEILDRPKAFRDETINW